VERELWAGLGGVGPSPAIMPKSHPERRRFYFIFTEKYGLPNEDLTNFETLLFFCKKLCLKYCPL